MILIPEIKNVIKNHKKASIYCYLINNYLICILTLSSFMAWTVIPEGSALIDSKSASKIALEFNTSILMCLK